jgi:peptidoglycan-associated lipoprotein
VKDTTILYGYVSSNRGSMDAGIDHVYFFSRILVLNAIGIVVDSVTRQPIEGATVELTDKATGKVIGSTLTDAEGNFKFILQPDNQYSVRATKDYYFADSRDLSTIGKDRSEDVYTRLRLLKKKKIFVLRNVLYDLDKADIRPDAARELDKLVEIMKNNPELTIELSSHCDIRGKFDYNMKLSQRRADSAVAYIISKGVDAKRLTAKGYGWTKPYVVNKEEASKLAPEGTELTPKYIKKVKKKEDQETLHQMNRRTEFKVTSEDPK